MIVANFVPLIGAYLGSGIASYVIYPIMLLAFVASVPCIIRKFWR